METNSYIGMYMYAEKFKSYYVVWKLCDEESFGLWKKKFKSYYVVWKLRRVASTVIMAQKV